MGDRCDPDAEGRLDDRDPVAAGDVAIRHGSDHDASARDAERLGVPGGLDCAGGPSRSPADRSLEARGNAVSVPVARWVGERLTTIRELRREGPASCTSGAKWPRAAWGSASGALPSTSRCGRSPRAAPPPRVPRVRAESAVGAGDRRDSSAAPPGYAEDPGGSDLRSSKHTSRRWCRSSRWRPDLRGPEVRRPRSVVNEDERADGSDGSARHQARTSLRRPLHARGLRYRVDRPFSPVCGVGPTSSSDQRRVVVFVDGCFWHGCPEHATWPKNNAEFWREKIETNRRRDRDTDRRLAEAGWTVVRVWEHEDAEAADASSD